MEPISMKAARVNADMTQSDMALKMGVSNKTIMNWETGKIIPKPAQFKMYCDIVGRPEDDILLPINRT